VTGDKLWCTQNKRSRCVGDGIVIRTYVQLGGVPGGMGWRSGERRCSSPAVFPVFVVVRCPVVLLLLSNVRILCWLVVVHRAFISENLKEVVYFPLVPAYTSNYSATVLHIWDPWTTTSQQRILTVDNSNKTTGHLTATKTGNTARELHLRSPLLQPMPTGTPPSCT
jgi:hypothetical protein